MISLATILGAVQDIALVGVLGIFVWLARKDYPYRAYRWLKRKARGEFASPSRAHPAARAVRGWSPLSEDEAREFGLIADMLTAGVEAPEAEHKAPRGEA